MMAGKQGSNNNIGDTGQAYLVLFLLFVGGLYLIPMVLPKLGYPGLFIIRVVAYFGLAITSVVLGVFTYEMYKCCRGTKRVRIIRD